MPGFSVTSQKYSSGHSILTYRRLHARAADRLGPGRTRFGLRLRAVGENPHAVDTAGISVARLRYQAVIIAGVLCGIAGAFISISLSASFVRDMTAGMGFMALAALIFANWRAWPALGACLLFGFLQASGTLPARASNWRRGSAGAVHQHAALSLTVILLAGFIGKSIPPRASGIPYIKDR